MFQTVEAIVAPTSAHDLVIQKPLTDAVQRILAVSSPSRIILFGS